MIWVEVGGQELIDERRRASPEFFGRALILMRFWENENLFFWLWTHFSADRFLRDRDAHAHRLVRLWRTLPGTSFAKRNRVQRFFSCFVMKRVKDIVKRR